MNGASGDAGADRTGIVRAVIVTMVALLAYHVVEHVPLPGVSREAIASSGLPLLRRLSILSVGLTAWLSALILAELATLLLPARLTGPVRKQGHADAFAMPVLVLAMCLAAFQAYVLADTLQSVSELVPEPGEAFLASSYAALMAGVLVTFLLGYVIEHAGIGRGFWVLWLAATVVSNLVADVAAATEGLRSGRIPEPLLLAYAAGILVVTASVVALVLARRRMGFAAAEPLIWPLQIYALAAPWLVIGFGLATGSLDDPTAAASLLEPPHPFGLLVMLALLAGIGRRYAHREGSAPLLWPTLLLLAIANAAYYQLRQLAPFSPLPAAEVVTLAAIGAVILADLGTAWNGDAPGSKPQGDTVSR
jgi:hypothetical protein